jgi:hypothetical protein
MRSGLFQVDDEMQEGLVEAWFARYVAGWLAAWDVFARGERYLLIAHRTFIGWPDDTIEQAPGFYGLEMPFYWSVLGSVGGQVAGRSWRIIHSHVI